MDSPNLGGFGVPRCAVGRDVYVFKARVFADFSESGLGMFLR
jgi:hypothetical protein